MSFSIDFVPVAEYEPVVGYALGCLRLGDEREYFRASLSYWGKEDYQAHWHKAVTRIIRNEGPSALLTDAIPPEEANFISWWMMWRMDDMAVFQEGLLMMEDLTEPFSLDNPHAFVGQYNGNLFDDGSKISEWRVPVHELESFINREYK